MPRRSSSKAPPPVRAFDAAVGLMARRAHSQAELRQKLGRRGYDEAEVEAAVTRLMEVGLQSDRVFAEGHVWRRSRSLGPLALAAELASRGVDRETADRALAGLSPQAEVLAAHRLAGRLAGNTEFATYQALLRSVGAKLLRRGFSIPVARAACDAVWTGTSNTPEA